MEESPKLSHFTAELNVYWLGAVRKQQRPGTTGSTGQINRRAASAQSNGLSAVQMQNIFARRRENEQIRTEKNNEVARYYDKWGRITTRYNNWTNPEYYQNSDEMLKREEEEKRKKEMLEVRRGKLKALLNEESEMFQREIQEMESKRIKPKNKYKLEVLENLNSDLTEQNKKRRDIEAKLYSKWRYGMTRDDIILDSKNQHQAMAKLNWLDKQVEDQIERDREKREFEEMKMKNHSEMIRKEELEMEKKKLIDSEIKELRRILEFNILELKARENDSQKLRDENSKLSDLQSDLESEQMTLKRVVDERSFKSFNINNFNRLKMLLRDECEHIYEDIQKDIMLLEQIKTLIITSSLYEKEEKNFNLLAFKFDKELIDLKTDHEKITVMYESEVKAILLKQERIWKENATTRFRLLNNLIEELISKATLEIRCNTQELAELTHVKESHLKTIESTNEKLKELNHQNRSSISTLSPNIVESSRDLSSSASVCTNKSTSNFSSIGDQLQTLHINDQKSIFKGSGLPQFGRKKIAWF